MDESSGRIGMDALTKKNMVIVHYIMGIPPLRGGGLIKYAIDLAEMQNKLGQKTYILYAGEFRRRKENCIHRRKVINGVEYYEIINPLPVSISSGMCSADLFMQSGNEKIYDDFLQNKHVNILHIHSLMGLHVELINAAKKIGVKTIFTSHDYFGICPKADLLYKNKICTQPTGENCNICCPTPYSYNKLVRKQSHWFEWCLKRKLLVEIYEKLTEKKINNIDSRHAICDTNYKVLLQYYKNMFEKIDLFHYNSSVAKEQYEKYFGKKNSIVLGVMHQGIQDKRKIRRCNGKLHFGFLGGTELHKGYELLTRAVKEVQEEYSDRFVLDIYTKQTINAQCIANHGVYTYNQIDDIFEKMDVLIAPSVCAETYGFVVLEALAHGRPVIISKNVGAKDLLEKFPGSGLIINATAEQLKETLRDLIENPKKIDQMNRYICGMQINIDYKEYVSKVEQMYAMI